MGIGFVNLHFNIIVQPLKSGQLSTNKQSMSLYSKRGVSAQKEEVHAAVKKLDMGL